MKKELSMRLGALVVVGAFAGCSPAAPAVWPEASPLPAPSAAQPAQVSVPAKPPRVAGGFDAEVAISIAAMNQGAFADAKEALAAAATREDTFEQTYHLAYLEATLAAFEGRLDVSAERLTSVLSHARSHTDGDKEFWLHNELTWVRWAAGDLAGALAECDAMRDAVDRSTLAKAAKNGLMLHQLWDHAYLLLEVADAQPASSRAAAVSYANDARERYDELAKPSGDHDGMAVLEAFFLLHEHAFAGARDAAKKVDIEKDSDLQDLYVIALALAASGDAAGAGAVRARIRGSKNVYLMRPLIVQRMDRDAKK
ncbi:MAG: hypothetical protein ABIP89_01455 [Polyangiaceae bacterium]